MAERRIRPRARRPGTFYRLWDSGTSQKQSLTTYWALLASAICINPVFSGFSEIPGCSEVGTKAFVAVPSHSEPDLAQNGQSLGTAA